MKCNQYIYTFQYFQQIQQNSTQFRTWPTHGCRGPWTCQGTTSSAFVTCQRTLARRSRSSRSWWSLGRNGRLKPERTCSELQSIHFEPAIPSMYMCIYIILFLLSLLLLLLLIISITNIIVIITLLLLLLFLLLWWWLLLYIIYCIYIY